MLRVSDRAITAGPSYPPPPPPVDTAYDGDSVLPCTVQIAGDGSVEDAAAYDAARPDGGTSPTRAIITPRAPAVPNCCERSSVVLCRLLAGRQLFARRLFNPNCELSLERSSAGQASDKSR